jgi:Reverse transcriptase (RNA-dependent DNA polymerase)
MESAIEIAGLGDILRQGEGAGHVQRFPNRELALHLEERDWGEWLVDELGRFRTELKRGTAPQQSGKRAITLQEAEAEAGGFGNWLQPFKAGELFANAQVWERVFSSFGHTLPGKLKKWLREGYSTYIQIHKLGKQPGRHRLEGGELAFAQQQAKEWVSMNAIEDVSGQIPPDWIVCNTVVAYRNGVMDRICWAGGPMNEGVQTDSFRMENVAVVLRLLRPGDFMFSFDLKKGYFQVPLKPEFQKFALMQVGARIYKWKVLMFGLSCAPKDFSFIVKHVLALLREKGHRICFYIDDIIGMAESEAAALALRTEVLRLFYSLGFFVSWKKSLLGVGQLIRHLGLDICSVDRSVWVPDDKVLAVKAEAACMLRGEGGDLTGYRVAALVGRVLSWRWACPAGLVLTRGLQKLLEQLPGAWITEKNKNQWRLDYSKVIILTDWAKAELRIWASKGIWKLRSATFRETTEVIAFVDACPSAGRGSHRGAHLSQHGLSRICSTAFAHRGMGTGNVCAQFSI